MMQSSLHWGTTLDALLAVGGIPATAMAEAVTRVVAWQLGEETVRQDTAKVKQAELSRIGD
jgi:hypothetical protein